VDAGCADKQPVFGCRSVKPRKVNAFTLQYFINYNLKKGYYVTLAPIITADWNAPGGTFWLVPIGGGIGRIMRLGFQPVNVSVLAYGNAKRPDNFLSPTWQLKFQIAFLYPKRRIVTKRNR
jgi:hypothetical protein